MNPDPKYFTRSQIKWIQDEAPLKIIEKSRQVGVTHATNYRLVSMVSQPGAASGRPIAPGQNSTSP